MSPSPGTMDHYSPCRTSDRASMPIGLELGEGSETVAESR